MRKGNAAEAKVDIAITVEGQALTGLEDDVRLALQDLGLENGLSIDRE